MSENPFPKFKDGEGKPITRENMQANAWDMGWNEAIDEGCDRLRTVEWTLPGKYRDEVLKEAVKLLEALRKPSQEVV